jgi:hypothetical protein
VQWLFDKDQHSGGLLDEQEIGPDIDTWLPKEERVYGSDDRYGYQVFYHRVPDPGTGAIEGSRTFVVYVVVQKAPADATGDVPYDRLARPRKATVSSASGQRITLSGGPSVRPGAILGTVESGSWYKVREVDSGGNVYLTRAAGGLNGKQVWVVNDAVEVFAAMVNKQRVPKG